jgi:AcrR family transcriptional regulator
MLFVDRLVNGCSFWWTVAGKVIMVEKKDSGSVRAGRGNPEDPAEREQMAASGRGNPATSAVQDQVAAPSVQDQVAAMAAAPSRSYAKFAAISEEKRQGIITAALKEFAKCGYAQVSTNAVIKSAGISKGLLFYYFGSKAGLYDYLRQYVMAQFAQAVLTDAVTLDGDIFDVLRSSTVAKLRVAQQLPLETSFYVRCFTDDSVPAEIMAAKRQEMDAAFGMLAQISANLDARQLKAGLDKEIVASVIYLVCEGLAREVLLDMNPEVATTYWQEQTSRIERYLDFLRQLFYRDAGEKDGDSVASEDNRGGSFVR